MSKSASYEKKTEDLILPILNDHSFELVDVEFVKEAGNYHLVCYIDKEGGITIDDLTMVNHELSDLMDKHDFIEESYILEVSSPGLLRPFKKPKDYIRNIGNDVEVKLFSPIKWEEDGKTYSDKEFIGILKSYDETENKITLDFEKNSLDILVKDIALIRKSIDF